MTVSATTGTQPAQLNAAPLKAGHGDSTIQNLTDADFELVYQATGVRITKDSELIPTFAAQIGIDRKNGMFPKGQPVDASYLRDLVDLYKDKGGGMSDQANLALEYLTKGKAPGRSVSL